MSSRVVVSGERLRNAASRLQLEMWLLCECGPSLREFMSSIMRWRSGLKAMDGADRVTRRANVRIVDRPCHCSPALNLGFPAARISGGWLMRRRNFLSVLGGAAAWPLAARAQQGERMRRIGVLMNKAADDAEGRAQLS